MNLFKADASRKRTPLLGPEGAMLLEVSTVLRIEPG